MYTLKSDDLKYPQPVPRGSAGCFAKPSTTTAILTKPGQVIMDSTNEDARQNTQETKDVVLQMEKTGDGLSERQGETDLCDVNMSKDVTAVKKEFQSDVDMCAGTSVDNAKGQSEDSPLAGVKGHSVESVVVEDALLVKSDAATNDGITSASSINSQSANLEQCNTGNSNIAKDLTAQHVNTGQDKALMNEASKEVNTISSIDLEVHVKLLKHAKAVQGESKALQDKAVEFQSGLVRDVDLLTALHRDLCEASESIVKIADSFKPLLQRASNESAKEISSHVTRLLESRERLNEQINLTEGLLKGGKKTIGVLQHLTTENKKCKTSRRRVDSGDSSSDDYISDDDDDAGSQTGSIGSIGSNASGRGSTRSRPKVLSSRLLRHNRNQQPRMLTKKRPPPQPLAACERICTEVTHTWTLVDVMWQVRLMHYFNLSALWPVFLKLN